MALYIDARGCFEWVPLALFGCNTFAIVLQEKDLLQLFSFCLQVVQAFHTRDGAQVGPADKALCKQMLQIIETVLSWEFTPKNNILSLFADWPVLTYC